MAQQHSKIARDFLKKLGTDPQTLGEFIKDPEGVMKAHKIRNVKERSFIMHCLALEVAKKLVVFPVAFHVHWE